MNGATVGDDASAPCGPQYFTPPGKLPSIMLPAKLVIAVRMVELMTSLPSAGTPW